MPRHESANAIEKAGAIMLGGRCVRTRGAAKLVATAQSSTRERRRGEAIHSCSPFLHCFALRFLHCRVLLALCTSLAWLSSARHPGVRSLWTTTIARIAVMGLVAAAVSVSSAAQLPRPARELQIEEVEAVVLPDDVGILGGTFAADGSVILWGANALWTHSMGERGVRPICRNLAIAPRYAAASAIRGHYEVLDSASSRVLRIQPEDPCVPRTVWQTSGRPSIVGRTGTSWLEIVLASSTQLIVQGPGRVQRDSIVSIPFEQPIRIGAVEDYVTSAAPDAMLVTEIAFPYRTFRISSRAKMTVAIDPASQLSPRDRVSVLAGWESLRVVRLDDAFIQILADPRSDQRRILVFDTRGQMVRSTLLDVALGVLDANQRSHILIALRNVGRSELVYYRWHWRS